jgi:hypothetical protein
MAALTYTAEELEEIRKLFVSGVRKVKYKDREIEYRDFAELVQIQATANGTGAGYRTFAQNSRGLK